MISVYLLLDSLLPNPPETPRKVRRIRAFYWKEFYFLAVFDVVVWLCGCVWICGGGFEVGAELP